MVTGGTVLGAAVVTLQKYQPVSFLWIVGKVNECYLLLAIHIGIQ